MKGTDFVSIGYEARRIMEAASAAYWLEGRADGSVVEHQRGEIRRALAELKALIESEAQP